MKKLLYLIILVFLSAFDLKGQQNIPVSANINILQPYPTSYAYWVGNYNQYIITLNNTSDTPFDFYFKISLEGYSGNEEVLVAMPDDYFPNQSFGTIQPGEIRSVTSMEMEEVFDNLSLIDIVTSPNVDLTDLTGNLPEGLYSICIEVLEHLPGIESALSPKICSETFYISNEGLQLTLPMDGYIAPVDQPINFLWHSTVSNAMNNTALTYTLSLYDIGIDMIEEESIYELVDGGVIMETFKSSPLMEQSFVYDNNTDLTEVLAPLEYGHSYAARVEVSDISGSTNFQNNKSNIVIFWYGDNPFDDIDAEIVGSYNGPCIDLTGGSETGGLSPINAIDINADRISVNAFESDISLIQNTSFEIYAGVFSIADDVYQNDGELSVFLDNYNNPEINPDNPSDDYVYLGTVGYNPMNKTFNGNLIGSQVIFDAYFDELVSYPMQNEYQDYQDVNLIYYVKQKTYLGESDILAELEGEDQETCAFQAFTKYNNCNLILDDGETMYFSQDETISYLSNEGLFLELNDPVLISKIEIFSTDITEGEFKARSHDREIQHLKRGTLYPGYDENQSSLEFPMNYNIEEAFGADQNVLGDIIEEGTVYVLWISYEDCYTPYYFYTPETACDMLDISGFENNGCLDYTDPVLKIQSNGAFLNLPEPASGTFAITLVEYQDQEAASAAFDNGCDLSSLTRIEAFSGSVESIEKTSTFAISSFVGDDGAVETIKPNTVYSVLLVYNDCVKVLNYKTAQAEVECKRFDLARFEYGGCVNYADPVLKIQSNGAFLNLPEPASGTFEMTIVEYEDQEAASVAFDNGCNLSSLTRGEGFSGSVESIERTSTFAISSFVDDDGAALTIEPNTVYNVLLVCNGCVKVINYKTGPLELQCDGFDISRFENNACLDYTDSVLKIQTNGAFLNLTEPATGTFAMTLVEYEDQEAASTAFDTGCDLSSLTRGEGFSGSVEYTGETSTFVISYFENDDNYAASIKPNTIYNILLVYNDCVKTLNYKTGPCMPNLYEDITHEEDDRVKLTSENLQIKLSSQPERYTPNNEFPLVMFKLPFSSVDEAKSSANNWQDLASLRSDEDPAYYLTGGDTVERNGEETWTLSKCVELGNSIDVTTIDGTDFMTGNPENNIAKPLSEVIDNESVYLLVDIGGCMGVAVVKPSCMNIFDSNNYMTEGSSIMNEYQIKLDLGGSNNSIDFILENLELDLYEYTGTSNDEVLPSITYYDTNQADNFRKICTFKKSEEGSFPMYDLGIQSESSLILDRTYMTYLKPDDAGYVEGEGNLQVGEVMLHTLLDPTKRYLLVDKGCKQSAYFKVRSEQNTSDCNQNCNTELTNQTKINQNDAIQRINDESPFTIAGFDFYIDKNEFQAGTNMANSYTGVGYVTIPFLADVKIKVSFSNVIFNTQNQVISGNVKASNRVLANSNFNFDVESMEDLESTEGLTNAQNFWNYMDDYANDLMLAGSIATGNPVGMPLGTDHTIGGFDFKVGFTAMSFTPSGASTSFQIGIKVPGFQLKGGRPDDNWLVIGVRDLCIHKNGFGGELTAGVVQDFVMERGGEEFLQIYGLGRTNRNSGKSTYIKMDCEGFKEVSVAGEVLLPETFIAENAAGQIDPEIDMKAEFSFKVDRTVETTSQDEESSSLGFIAGVTFEPSTFRLDVGNMADAGVGFELEDAYIDLSEEVNPMGIRKPEGYVVSGPTSGNGNNLPRRWTGLYIKSLKVKLPEELNAENDRRLALGIENMLIDNSGLSINVKEEMEGVIPEENFTQPVSGWNFGFKGLELSIVQNDFQKFELSGALSAPFLDTVAIEQISGSGQSIDPYYYNKIVFTAGIGQLSSDNGVALLLSARLPRVMKFKGLKSFATFDQAGDNDRDASGFSLVLPLTRDGDPRFELDLHGDLQVVNTGSNQDTPTYRQDGSYATAGLSIISGKFPFNISFDSDAGFRTFSLGSPTATEYSGTTLGFGSNFDAPEASVSDSPESDKKGLAIEIKPSLNISGTRTSSGDKRSLDVSTVFTVSSGFKPDGSMSNVTLNFDKVSANIDLGPVKAVGQFEIVNEDNVDGFTGGIKLKVKPLGVEGQVSMGFLVKDERDVSERSAGSSYNGDTYYPIWFVDGKIAADNGISAGAVEFMGFGGGIYWNCAPKANTTSSYQGRSSGLISYDDLAISPDSCAFKANMILGIPKGQSFIIDGYASVVIDKANARLNSLSLGGEYFITNSLTNPYTDRMKDQDIWGAMDFTLEFTDPDLPEPPPGQSTDDEEIALKFSITNQAYVSLRLPLIRGENDDHKLELKGTQSYSGAPEGGVTSGEKFNSCQAGNIYFYMENYRNDDPKKFNFITGIGLKNDNGHHEIEPLSVSLSGSMASSQDDNASGSSSTNGGSLSVGIQTYMILGNYNVPTQLPPLPTVISDILYGPMQTEDEDGNEIDLDPVDDKEETLSQETQEGMATGAGLAFGAHIQLQAGFNAFVYGDLIAAVGLDVNLTKGNRTCEGSSVQSQDLWNASGRAYFALHGSVGVSLKVGKNGRNTIKIPAFTFTAGLSAEGSVPNPTYFKGAARLSLKVLMFRASIATQIVIGEQCIDPYGLELPIIAGAYPDYETNNPRIECDEIPYFSLNYPLNTNITVLDESNNPTEIQLSYDPDETYLRPKITSLDYSVRYEYHKLLFDHDSYWNDQDKALSAVMKGKFRMKDMTSGQWIDGASEEKEFLIKIKPAPWPIDSDDIELENPVNGERFYLSGETFNQSGRMTFEVANTCETYFASAKESRGAFNYDVSYEVDVYDDNFQLLYNTPLNVNFAQNSISFDLNNLETERSYNIIIAKKFTNVREGNATSQTISQQFTNVLNEVSTADLSRLYPDDNDVINAVGNGRLFRHIRVNTSQHLTLADKMSSIDQPVDVSCHDFTGRINYRSTLSEGFDKPGVSKIIAIETNPLENDNRLIKKYQSLRNDLYSNYGEAMLVLTTTNLPDLGNNEVNLGLGNTTGLNGGVGTQSPGAQGTVVLTPLPNLILKNYKLYNQFRQLKNGVEISGNIPLDLDFVGNQISSGNQSLAALNFTVGPLNIASPYSRYLNRELSYVLSTLDSYINTINNNPNGHPDFVAIRDRISSFRHQVRNLPLYRPKIRFAYVNSINQWRSYKKGDSIYSSQSLGPNKTGSLNNSTSNLLSGYDFISTQINQEIPQDLEK